MQKLFFKVACYVRVSTENQIENYSIDEQIERLKAYCTAKGWSIYRIYTDGGYSGGNTNRPALQQMLKDIHAGLIDMVAVYKLDRLSRSQKDTLTLIEDEFIANNVEFVSMNEDFDTSSPFGRAMIGILSVFAQLEKDQITERFTMGRIGRSKAGYYHGGPTPPTGYKYINGNLIVDEYKASQVKEVYKKFLNGYSINSIQKYMHNKYGDWSSHSLVINVLRNSVYIGKVKFKGVEYNGVHKPIINKEAFFETQKLLKSPERQNKKNSAQKTPYRAEHLLSSLIYCKKCGAKYNACHGYYKCYSRSKGCKKYIKDRNCKNRNYGIEGLDSIVVNEIKRLKYDKNYLKQILGNSTKQTGTDKKAIIVKAREIDTQINRMIDLYQIGTIPMEKTAERISALQKEKDSLNQKLAEPQVNSDKPIKKFFDTLSKLDEVFSSGSLEKERLFVSTLIQSIWIDDDIVNIKWRI